MVKAAEHLPEKVVLIHAASIVSTRQHLTPEALDELETGFHMASNLIEILKAKISSLCFLSSIDVYGPPDGRVVDENYLLQPDRIYGMSKCLVEDLFRQAGRIVGFPVTNLRLTHTYGPLEHLYSPTHVLRATRLIPSVLRACLKGEEINLYGGGDDMRDFIHSYDVAQAVLRALIWGDSGNFIIASGQSHSIKDITEIAIKATGSNPTINHVPRQAGRVKTEYRFDISRAKKYLNFNPMVKLLDGLRDEAVWMQKVNSDE